MDKILLEGIRLEIRVGVTAEERSQPQVCGLDLTLESRLKKAGGTGNLSRTIDYAAVFECLEKICTERDYELLEQIAERACEALLRQFPASRLRLKIRKLHPFSAQLAAVGIEIRRARKSGKKR